MELRSMLLVTPRPDTLIIWKFTVVSYRMVHTSFRTLRIILCVI